MADRLHLDAAWRSSYPLRHLAHLKNCPGLRGRQLFYVELPHGVLTGKWTKVVGLSRCRRQASSGSSDLWRFNQANHWRAASFTAPLVSKVHSARPTRPVQIPDPLGPGAVIEVILAA